MGQISSLAKYLGDRRRILRLSMAELAERLSANGYACTESAINHWEHGRANLPIEDAAFVGAMATSLEIPPADLIRATGVLTIPPEVSESVLSKLSPMAVHLLDQASAKEIKRVDAVIRAMLTEPE